MSAAQQPLQMVTLRCFTNQKCNLTRVFMAGINGELVASNRMLAIDTNLSAAKLVSSISYTATNMKDSTSAIQKTMERAAIEALLEKISSPGCNLQIRTDNDKVNFVLAITSEAPS